MTSTQITPTGKNSHHRKCILDIEVTNFQPWLGRIICIGLKDTDTGEIKIFQDKYEEAMLLQFLKYFYKKEYIEIVGYNINFDIRYLFAKCILYRVPANGFFSKRQTDLMILLKSVKRDFNYNRPGTLDEWAQSILGKRKLFHNSQIPQMYRQGKIQDIVSYNKNDLEITYELWKRIVFVLEK